MCIFSGPVKEVSATSVLARPLGGSRQLLVYQMSVVAPEPVAMVLPLPTPIGAGEDAVRFIDLSSYRDFFVELRAAFATWIFGPGLCAHEIPLPPLPVHEVGDFLATFVPRAADFARLDPRFRLDDDVLAAVPRYHDWGFVVFQLAGRAEAQTVHPMAIEFATRFPDRVYVPTTHAHGGAVPLCAEYDHEIYLQGELELDPWEQVLDELGHEPNPLRNIDDSVDRARVPGLPVAEYAARIVLGGVRHNQDTWFTRDGIETPALAAQPRPTRRLVEADRAVAKQA